MQNVSAFCCHLESTTCLISCARLLLYATSNMAASVVIRGQTRIKYDWILNKSMFLTHCFAHLVVLSFEIVFDQKILLTRLVRLISLAHWTTKLAQEENLLALGSGTCVFSCPDIHENQQCQK